MTAIIEHTLTVQLADAVDIVRSTRHHPECNCCQYRDTNRAGYCSSREHTATTIVNHLLSKVLVAESRQNLGPAAIPAV